MGDRRGGGRGRGRVGVRGRCWGGGRGGCGCRGGRRRFGGGFASLVGSGAGCRGRRGGGRWWRGGGRLAWWRVCCGRGVSRWTLACFAAQPSGIVELSPLEWLPRASPGLYGGRSCRRGAGRVRRGRGSGC